MLQDIQSENRQLMRGLRIEPECLSLEMLHLVLPQ